MEPMILPTLHPSREAAQSGPSAPTGTTAEAETQKKPSGFSAVFGAVLAGLPGKSASAEAETVASEPTEADGESLESSLEGDGDELLVTSEGDSTDPQDLSIDPQTKALTDESKVSIRNALGAEGEGTNQDVLPGGKKEKFGSFSGLWTGFDTPQKGDANGNKPAPEKDLKGETTLVAGRRAQTDVPSAESTKSTRSETTSGETGLHGNARQEDVQPQKMPTMRADHKPTEQVQFGHSQKGGLATENQGKTDRPVEASTHQVLGRDVTKSAKEQTNPSSKSGIAEAAEPKSLGLGRTEALEGDPVSQERMSRRKVHPADLHASRMAFAALDQLYASRSRTGVLNAAVPPDKVTATTADVSKHVGSAITGAPNTLPSAPGMSTDQDLVSRINPGAQQSGEKFSVPLSETRAGDVTGTEHGKIAVKKVNDGALPHASSLQHGDPTLGDASKRQAAAGGVSGVNPQRNVPNWGESLHSSAVTSSPAKADSGQVALDEVQGPVVSASTQKAQSLQTGHSQAAVDSQNASNLRAPNTADTSSQASSTNGDRSLAADRPTGPSVAKSGAEVTATAGTSHRQPAAPGGSAEKTPAAMVNQPSAGSKTTLEQGGPLSVNTESRVPGPKDAFVPTNTGYQTGQNSMVEPIDKRDASIVGTQFASNRSQASNSVEAPSDPKTRLWVESPTNLTTPDAGMVKSSPEMGPTFVRAAKLSGKGAHPVMEEGERAIDGPLLVKSPEQTRTTSSVEGVLPPQRSSQTSTMPPQGSDPQSQSPEALVKDAKKFDLTASQGDDFAAPPGAPLTGDGNQPSSVTTPSQGNRADLPRQIAQQIAASIQVLSDGTAEVALNPDELGRVKISISTQDAGVTISISAERGETLDLMRRHINALETAFRDLGHSHVAFNFEGKSDQQGARQDAMDLSRTDGDGQEIPSNTQPVIQPSGLSGLDIRV